MDRPLILASGSVVRAQLLSRAGVPVDVIPARIDEDSVKIAMKADGAAPRDIADTLAGMKAGKVASKHPDRLVLGCDQVLAFGDQLLSKPVTREEAHRDLLRLRGKRHMLLSAAVVFENNEPVWRHVGQVRLQMRDFTDAYLEEYLARNWDSIRHSVGGYKLEEEGVRLFSKIEGDYFNVLGLPLIELLSWMTMRGTLAS